MVIRLPSEEHKELVLKLLNSKAGDKIDEKVIACIGYYRRNGLSIVDFTFGELNSDEIITLEIPVSSLLAPEEEWPKDLLWYKDKYQKERQGMTWIDVGPREIRDF